MPVLPAASVLGAIDPVGEWPVFAYVLTGTILLVALGRFLLDRHVRAVPGRKLRAQIIMLSLVLTGAMAILLVIPFRESGTRGQFLTVMGIIVSAAIALSSTTFLGNLLAGLMLRSVRNFRSGDFLQCGEHFGRVTERGLLHTELQTEDRDLVTLPNLHLATSPVKVLRGSGTIVSATVSLGYDVGRERVGELLLAAAEDAGLNEPFVQVMELGDFSVTYRVAGLLTEVKKLMSTRSKLRSNMLDRLHGGGVEIVSPTFMNTRAYPPEVRFIPAREVVRRAADDGEAMEEVAFDKAELAQSVEHLALARDALILQRTELNQRLAKGKDDGERSALSTELEHLERRIARQEQLIARRGEMLKAQDDPASA